jgi:hypothetical protein
MVKYVYNVQRGQEEEVLWKACSERLERGDACFETEVNGDSKSTNERGSFLGWFSELVVPVQRIFVLPWLV